MAQVTITYTALVAPSADATAPICRIFMPNNAAADNAAFEGTYYDTNVEGWGEATTPDKFFADSVAHPGLVLALKTAVRDGECKYEENDAKEILYLKEVATAVADQGFTIEIADTDSEGN